MTTKLETYTANAAQSLAAAEAATTERDRAFHRRANGIWKKLIIGVGASEARAAGMPAPTPKPPKAAASKAAKRA